MIKINENKKQTYMIRTIYKTVDEVILDYNNGIVDYPSQFILTGGAS